MSSKSLSSGTTTFPQRYPFVNHNNDNTAMDPSNLPPSNLPAPSSPTSPSHTPPYPVQAPPHSVVQHPYQPLGVQVQPVPHAYSQVPQQVTINNNYYYGHPAPHTMGTFYPSSVPRPIPQQVYPSQYPPQYNAPVQTVPAQVYPPPMMANAAILPPPVQDASIQGVATAQPAQVFEVRDGSRPSTPLPGTPRPGTPLPAPLPDIPRRGTPLPAPHLRSTPRPSTPRHSTGTLNMSNDTSPGARRAPGHEYNYAGVRSPTEYSGFAPVVHNGDDERYRSAEPGPMRQGGAAVSHRSVYVAPSSPHPHIAPPTVAQDTPRPPTPGRAYPPLRTSAVQMNPRNNNSRRRSTPIPVIPTHSLTMEHHWPTLTADMTLSTILQGQSGEENGEKQDWRDYFEHSPDEARRNWNLFCRQHKWFAIPTSIKCTRSFCRDEYDAVYLDHMDKYVKKELFYETVVPRVDFIPLFTCGYSLLSRWFNRFGKWYQFSREQECMYPRWWSIEFFPAGVFAPLPPCVYYYRNEIVHSEGLERSRWYHLIQLEFALLFAACWWHAACRGHRAIVVQPATVNYLVELLGDVPIDPVTRHTGGPTRFTWIAKRMRDAYAEKSISNAITFPGTSLPPTYYVPCSAGTGYLNRNETYGLVYEMSIDSHRLEMVVQGERYLLNRRRPLPAGSGGMINKRRNNFYTEDEDGENC